MSNASVALILTITGHILIGAVQIDGARASPPTSSENAWFEMASAEVSSPVSAAIGDLSMHWYAPDGRLITLNVQRPKPASNNSTVALGNVPAGSDASLAFRTALAQVVATKAALLQIQKGTYTFYSLDPTGLGHLVLEGLSNLTIEGNGSTFIFMNNAPGIYLTTSRNLQIQDISIQYGLRMASLGTVQNVNGINELVISAAYPVTAADGIGHIAEYDVTSQSFVPGGQRVYLPTTVNYVGNQTYTSPSFSNPALLGRTYVVFHHYYGGAAVLMEDSPGPSQTQDITLDRVTVNSGPGMGIVVYGVKRGVLITNSQIAPLSGALISTEYDGIHILQAGGDVALVNNLISSQGDDGINLNTPVHPVVSINASGTSVILSTYSRFIEPGDTLAFFDSNDSFLGTTTVTGTQALGGLPHQINLSTAVPNFGSARVARDLALIDSRIAVLNNTIESCQCHGMLIQTPNTLVYGNTVKSSAAGGIELLTNIGAFQEGVGAINVTVGSNTLANTGFDYSLPMQWSAISVYGAINNGITTVPVNHGVLIEKNAVSSAVGEGCVTVASADSVSVTGNICNSTNLNNPSNTPSIWIVNANAVLLSNNARSGQTTGPIYTTDTDTNLTSQPNY